MRNYGIIIISAIIVGVLFGLLAGDIASRSRRWVSQTEDPLGQEKKQEEKEIAEDAAGEGEYPKAKIDSVVHDFGVLDKNAQTEKGEHDFTIENVGQAPLTLKEAGKGCMCTNFSISKDSIKPGEKATVKVKWDASRGGGVFDQSVRVATNDPAHKEIYLTIRGLYTAPVVSHPNQIMFSGITPGSSATREFKIYGFTKYDKDGKPFVLDLKEATISNSKFFDIKLEKIPADQLTEEEKKHELFRKAVNIYKGTITIKPGLPLGSFQEVARIRTNDGLLPVLEFMVEGQITGTIKVTGTRFDKMNSGHLAIGSISTRNTTKEKIRLTIIDPKPVTAENLKVTSLRPKWLKVDIHYPELEMQKTLPVKLIDVDVIIPAGSPTGNFMGPDKELLGEIIFSAGEGNTVREVIVPIQFAVGP